MRLVPCPGCERHVRSADPACPFCGRSIAGVEPRELGPLPMSRAAAVFLGAVAVAGCHKEPQEAPAPDASSFGPPEPTIATPVTPPSDTTPTSNAGTPAYGAPPIAIDAGARRKVVHPYGAPPIQRKMDDP